MFSRRDIQHRIYDLPEGANSYPFRSPRFWHGMRLGDSLRLLARHQFRVYPLSWSLAATVLAVGPLNSMLGWAQSFWWSRRVSSTEITQPPVFVIGHWRSGTTYMHELLACDPRLSAPSTYACFSPSHFLVSQNVLAPLTQWLLPGHRPQDDVKLGWDQPQEDEFALCNLGVPSPYLQIAFPNDPPAEVERYLTLRNVSAKERARWTEALFAFYRALTCRSDKRLLIKSPTHTGRAWLLAQLFPGAKFIHMVRDPNTMIPSTIRMWRSFFATQSFQRPRNEGLEGFIFQWLQTMYEGGDAWRGDPNDADWLDVHYEKFVDDPVKTMEGAYERLEIGDFEAVRENVESYVSGAQSYRTNRHSLNEELGKNIAVRCAEYRERFGYGPLARNANGK